jgi:hypothetical protein
MTQFTIDVSNHDTARLHGRTLDWARVRASGIVGMCAKATEGDPGAAYHYEDPTFSAHVNAAHFAGMPLIGGYHVLAHPGEPGAMMRQVRWLLDHLGHGMWAMVDVEPFQELADRGIVPDWTDVQMFCGIWSGVTKGRPLGVYLPKWVWSGYLGSPDMSHLPSNCFLIASDYGANGVASPATLYAGLGGSTGRGWATYGGRAPELWQFGAKAQVPGASDATDVNAWLGSLAQLQKRLLGGAMTSPFTPGQENAFTLMYQAAHAVVNGETATVSGGGQPGGDEVYLTKALRQIIEGIANWPLTVTITDTQAAAMADAIAVKLAAIHAESIAVAVAEELQRRLAA